MNQVLDAETLDRTLTRMAHEIQERNPGLHKVVLLGIETRGATLAFRLAKRIEKLYRVPLPVASLDISFWRDDREPVPAAFRLPLSVQDRIVVLVDDVLFSGRSVRAAMDGVIFNGRPQQIQLVTLIDRGHRELPIRADVVGKNIPTSKQEKVQVSLTEVDGIDAVVVI